jgi:hypothetical protein
MTAAASPARPTEVYALFSDCSAARVILTVNSRRPEDPTIVIPINPNHPMRPIAERALASTMTFYKNLKNPPYTGRLIVWDFSSNPSGLNNYEGPSAGLAFFIRFMEHLLATRNVRVVSFSVAATGELSDHTDNAIILPVKFLPEKISAALTVLKSGDKVFYPQGNQDDIGDELRRKAGSQKIELVPVATAEQMAEIIRRWFHDGRPHLLREAWNRLVRLLARHTWTLILAAATVLAALLYWSLTSGLNRQTLIRFIEQGQFDRVPLARLQSARDPRLLGLAQQTSASLTMSNSFIYQENDQQVLQNATFMTRMQNVALCDSQGYRFEVEVDRSCYYYLFQFQDGGLIDLLFPASNFDLNNHFLQDHTHNFIPACNSYFYFTRPASHRLVTLFFLGSVWRARDLEALCRSYGQAQSDSARNVYYDRLIQGLQRRSDALADGWGGIYLLQGYFWRQ